MHRTNPFLETFSLDANGKESDPFNESIDRDVGLVTLPPSSVKNNWRLASLGRKRNLSCSLASRRKASLLPGTAPHTVAPYTSCGNSNVIEPIRMLHNCIRYFASHPDIYGNNLHALLDRELMYVMRVKASETALVTPRMIPVGNAILPALAGVGAGGTSSSNNNNNNNSTATKDDKLQHPALSKCVGWMVTPRSIDAAVSPGTVAGGEGMFGFGSTTFLEGTPEFFRLLDKASRRVSLRNEQYAGFPEEFDVSNEVSVPTSTVTDLSQSARASSSQEIQQQQQQQHDSTRVRFVSPGKEAQDPSTFSSFLQPKGGVELVIDGTSYEVSFLRSQLQQVEAAYNAKCISNHELHQETEQYKSELTIMEKKLNQSLTKNQEMQIQIESMRRELDAWKQRSSELALIGQVGGAQASSEGSRRVQAMQLGQVRRELTHMSRLWRETEKSLQETKRVLESAEKESQLSYRYLKDAFSLIERLERRIARRDRFIEVQERRQASLEEKYEKLMWCLEELQTIKSGDSYIDHLLSEDYVWSLFLFVRLQKRLMGYSPVEEPYALTPTPLYFRRTPFGGKLSDMYDTQLVSKLMMMEDLSIETEQSTAIKDIKSKVSLPQWRRIYTIECTSIFSATDHMNAGGNASENMVVNVSESANPRLHILSLASVLLPPPNNTNTNTTTNNNSLLLNDTSAVLEEGGGAGTTAEEVINSGQYNQGTLRLILYTFWGERLLAYKKEMEKRLVARRRKSMGYHVFKPQEGGSETNTEESTNVVSSLPTFLAALVEFVQRNYPLSTREDEEEGGEKGKQKDKKDGGKNERQDDDFINTKENTKKTVIRGVLSKHGKTSDGKSLLFSSIVTVMGDGTEVPVVLSPQAREVLYALFYYAEEYKEVDADFRLFFLVAHQQIPETVAINFWASLEAIRKSCEESLCRHLGPQYSTERSAGKPESQRSTSIKTPKEIFMDETPCNVLKAAVDVIDGAPLLEEDTCIEPDSEGEGYGLILPGGKEGNGNDALDASNGGGNLVQTSRAADFNALKHNIHQYLYPPPAEEEEDAEGNEKSPEEVKEAEENNKKKETKGPPRENKTDGGGNGGEKEIKGIPPAWVALDEKLGAVLGPHRSLLEAFRANNGPCISREEKRKREHFQKEAASFSASRGLLPMDEIMELMYRHCFATYAVSCCGGSRFSLLEALARSGDVLACGDSPSHVLEPLTIIGFLPPSETQMRRLRFAICMDQPSALLRYTDFFDMDCRYGFPSHFRDEYLQLTLDTYMEHQDAWMSAILLSIIPKEDNNNNNNNNNNLDDLNPLQREQLQQQQQYYVDEVDMTVPFSLIRSGILRVFRQVLQSPEQANILAKHYLHYCEALTYDDDIRFEQFTDAPVFINSPSLTVSETNEKFLKMQKRRWPVEEEASLCSLLHPSLAIRMTYIVWGFNALPSSKLVVSVLRSITNGKEEGSVDSSSGRGTFTKGVGEIKDERFSRKIRGEFMDSLNRIRTGVTQHNSLRQLCPDTAATTTRRATEVNINPLNTLEAMKNNVCMQGELDLSMHVRRLYAQWDIDQQRQRQRTLVSAAHSRRKSKTPRRMTAPDLIPNTDQETTIDRFYIPEITSLAKFLGVATAASKSSKNDKKKRVKSNKNFQDTSTFSFAPCATYEAVYMSHQTQIMKLLVEAGNTPDLISTSVLTDAVMEEDNNNINNIDINNNNNNNNNNDVHDPLASKPFISLVQSRLESTSMGSALMDGENAGAGFFLGLPDVLSNASDAVQKGKEEMLQKQMPLRKLYAGCATLSLM